MQYAGSCHCGRVKYTVEGEIGKVIECNCSHCARKGLLLWFVPRDKLALSTPDAELATYEFNRHVIEHRFCPACGVQPFAFGRDPKTGADTAAINVRCLEQVDLGALERLPYDGRSH